MTIGLRVYPALAALILPALAYSDVSSVSDAFNGLFRSGTKIIALGETSRDGAEQLSLLRALVSRDSLGRTLEFVALDLELTHFTSLSLYLSDPKQGGNESLLNGVLSSSHLVRARADYLEFFREVRSTNIIRAAEGRKPLQIFPIADPSFKHGVPSHQLTEYTEFMFNALQAYLGNLRPADTPRGILYMRAPLVFRNQLEMSHNPSFTTFTHTLGSRLLNEPAKQNLEISIESARRSGMSRYRAGQITQAKESREDSRTLDPGEYTGVWIQSAGPGATNFMPDADRYFDVAQKLMRRGGRKGPFLVKTDSEEFKTAERDSGTFSDLRALRESIDYFLVVPQGSVTNSEIHCLGI